ncbi:GNAT family N-acetyltransferase [Rathayibacter soli]|uniref:GNAT family N-acetyltransferase n=1 Tax=Rathayibacter soli TaxID=3144168 RepID=UPI0027E514A6|nr:GNAT family N-acetyltransferase [Glaciibacter superstes]
MTRSPTTRPRTARPQPTHSRLTRRLANAADEPFIRSTIMTDRAAQFMDTGLDPSALDSLLELQYLAQCREYATRYPGAAQELVESGGVAVGRIITAIDGGCLHLVDILIADAYRRLGIGSQVLTDLCECADAAGAPITLTVWAQNTGALRLYERHGFHRVDDGAQGGYLGMRREARGNIFQAAHSVHEVPVPEVSVPEVPVQEG